MSHMLALLDEMRQRRSIAVYVGTVSLLKLADFLHGYEYALQRLDVREPPLLTPFREWVQQRFGTAKESWEQLIVASSGGDADAIKEFWRLLDTFLEQRPEYRRHTATPPLPPTTASPPGYVAAAKS